MKDTVFVTWFELYPVKSKVDGKRAWIGAGVILGLAVVIDYLVTDNREFLFTFLPLAVGGGMLAAITRSGYEILTEWKDEMFSFIRDERYTEAKLDEWLRSHFRRGSRFWPPFACGITFCVISFLVWGRTNVFVGLGPVSLIISVSVLIFTAFSCDVVLCLLYYLANLIRDLGKFRIVLSPHSYGILSLGGVLLQIYVRCSLVWFVIALSGVVGFKENPLPMAILALPTLLFVVGSFVFIQFPVHRQMSRYKKEELKKVDAVLRDLMPYPVDECSPERLEQLKFYRKMAKTISNLPEWPYHWKSAAGVTLSALLAVSPSVGSFLVSAGALNKILTYIAK